VTVLNAAGSAIVAYSPVTGGYLAVDDHGGLYPAGTTRTLAFLSTPHAFQIFYGGGDADGSAAKLDLSQPAGPELSSVVNAATFLGGSSFPAAGGPSIPVTGAIAPGEIITLFGNGFGSQPSVSFDTSPAPILYSSNCQINAVVPFSIKPGMPSFGPFSTSSTFVSVLSGGQTIGLMQLPVVAAVPGIFTVNGTGTGQAAIINQDGTNQQRLESGVPRFDHRHLYDRDRRIESAHRRWILGPLDSAFSCSPPEHQRLYRLRRTRRVCGTSALPNCRRNASKRTDPAQRATWGIGSNLRWGWRIWRILASGAPGVRGGAVKQIVAECGLGRPTNSARLEP